MGHSDEAEREEVWGPEGWRLGVPQREQSGSGTQLTLTPERSGQFRKGEREGEEPALIPPGLGYLG